MELGNDAFGFDFSMFKEEEKRSGALPAGNYTVIADSAQIKQNKKKNGHYVALQLSICDGKKYNNKKLFDYLNFDNPNETAQEMGRGRLKRLLNLSGVKESDMAKASPQSIVGKKFGVYVSIDKQEGREDGNRISSYSEVKAGTMDASPEANGSEASRPSWC